MQSIVTIIRITIINDSVGNVGGVRNIRCRGRVLLCEPTFTNESFVRIMEVPLDTVTMGRCVTVMPIIPLELLDIANFVFSGVVVRTICVMTEEWGRFTSSLGSNGVFPCLLVHNRFCACGLWSLSAWK